MQNQRKFLRLECTFSVEIVNIIKEQAVQAQAKNISSGGICLITDKPLPKNTNFFLKFFFPDRLKSYNIEGHSVWSKQVDNNGRQGYENGIEFLRINREITNSISGNIINLHLDV